jgi:hypothetical protein
MSRTNERILDEVRYGRLSEVPQFILEHISRDGADDPYLIEEMVEIYFERLDSE